ncbi:MAG: helicase-related protein, partial [Candidatus Hadarchaeales archaeon]
LVVLPTALGKTVVAILAVGGRLERHWDKRALVLAPTRPLVQQHFESFRRFLRVGEGRIRVVTGETRARERLLLWSNPETKVYISTPQCVENDMERGLSLRDFCMLVFDEAHRARKNYSYTAVARRYLQECPSPHILALTASPGSSREQVMEICNALGIERIEARTEYDPDVQPYVNPVRTEWREVELPKEYLELSRLLGELKLERLREISREYELGKAPSELTGKELVELVRKLGEKASLNPSLWRLVSLAAEAHLLNQCIERLESQGREALKAFLGRVGTYGKRCHRIFLSDLETLGIPRKVDSLPPHPKLEALLSILQQGSFGRAIVFAQYRDTARWLVEELRKRGFEAERVVGQAEREGDPGMSQQEQLAALERFRRGETKILVCSQVGEEGLDIPQADLAILFEPVPSEIRLIQRRGRTGRAGFGRAVVLVGRCQTDNAYRWVSVRRERRMRWLIPLLNRQLTKIQREEEKEVPAPEELLEGGKEGVRKLAEGMVKKVYSGEEVPPASLSALREDGALGSAGGEEREFEVERVYEGGAIVRVDGKWYAVVDAGDCHIPRFLLRKGETFRARAELYRRDGKLHAVLKGAP